MPGAGWAGSLVRLRAAWQNALPSHAARRLVAARTVRSLGQGALSVDFALYARALHWSPVFLGTVIGFGLLISAAVTAVIGPLSDRFGRRGFLVGYEVFAVVTALAAIMVAGRWPLAAIAASGLGTRRQRRSGSVRRSRAGVAVASGAAAGAEPGIFQQQRRRFFRHRDRHGTRRPARAAGAAIARCARLSPVVRDYGGGRTGLPLAVAGHARPAVIG
jgi:MFS family permease